MARPRASAEQRRVQRERIQHAAAEIYRENGLGATSVRAVCVRAGVSTGTLYSHFTGLEELLQSLWLEPVARLNEGLERDLADVADPVERIRLLLEAYARFAIESPEVFRGAVLFVRPPTIPTPIPDPADDLPFHRLLRTAVHDGQNAGALRAGDPTIVGQVLWAGIHGAVALPVNIDRFAVESQQVLAQAMIEMLLDSITA